MLLSELAAIGTHINSFKAERKYAWRGECGHEHATAILELTEPLFDVLDMRIDPDLRSALSSMRAARARVDGDLRDDIDTAIRKLTVKLISAAIDDEAIPSAAPSDDDVASAPEPAPMATTGHSSDDADELGARVMRDLTMTGENVAAAE